ncbi:MAG: class I SAM-dependent methyltransferase [Candidatus Deferrimicrobiaceae bacterium]
MSPRQVRILEDALRDLRRSPVRVLEWGSGASTAHFPAFLERLGIAYSWLSVEHDREWFETVSRDVTGNPNIRIVLVEPGPGDPRSRECPMEEYISFPSAAGGLYDFIFVDGRKRRRCLLEARRLLSPGGVVFLHDARRKRYHCALPAFSDSRFVHKHLWRGANEPVTPFRRALSGANRLIHRYFGKFLPE